MSKYPNDPEQTTWIALAKKGDGVAFNNIVERYQKPIYNLCYRMLNNGEEAEDAAQEVFIRAFRKLDTFVETYKFSTWLFSIASHYCIDQLKKRRLQLVSWDDFDPWNHFPSQDSPQPEEVLLEAEGDQEVRELLDALSPDYRTIIILKYWYTMSYEEIAITLEMTVSAVKSKLFRARRMLADQVTTAQAVPSRRDYAANSSQAIFNSPREIAQMEVM